MSTAGKQGYYFSLIIEIWCNCILDWIWNDGKLDVIKAFINVKCKDGPAGVQIDIISFCNLFKKKKFKCKDTCPLMQQAMVACCCYDILASAHGCPRSQQAMGACC